MSDKKAQPLVSLLTPCYNTGNYIHHLLDSVLTQDYPRIEMFVIDDGSTDNSRTIIESYIDKFNSRGYSLTYVYQENQGQSAAINNGLKLINGEYLAWPDSDDWYASEKAISTLVGELENAGGEFGMVRCRERVVGEQNHETIYETGLGSPKFGDKSLFYDCLFCLNGYYFCSGAYMLRISDLDNVNGRDIYTEKNAGQNWQLMLPMLYDFRCITVPEVMYAVLDRQDSHSRGQYKTYAQKIAKFASYENTILATLARIKSMPKEERKDLEIQIKRKYLFQKFDMAYCEGQRADQKKTLAEIRDLGFKVPKEFMIRYYASRMRVGRVYNFMKRIYIRCLK